MKGNVTSKDGTTIAFERLGEGEPVIVVGGLFCAQLEMYPLAEQLAQQFSVINYDRRGRGDSSDTAPYSPLREVEDIAALIAEVGGDASVYGHSSGAALALNAAACALPITKLVLHEPPYGADDEESKRDARELAEKVKTAIAENRPADAITLFLTASGMPPEAAAGMSGDPRILAVAPTMPYDFDVMADSTRGGTIPEEIVRSIDTSTLVIAGTASPDFFRDTASRLVEILPNGSYAVLEGQDHGAPADVVAPVVAEFLTA